MSMQSSRALLFTERLHRRMVHQESLVLTRLRREMHRIRTECAAEGRRFDLICAALESSSGAPAARAAAGLRGEPARRALALTELRMRAEELRSGVQREASLSAATSLHLGRLTAARARAERCEDLHERSTNEKLALTEALDESDLEDDRTGVAAALTEPHSNAYAVEESGVGGGRVPNPEFSYRERDEERRPGWLPQFDTAEDSAPDLGVPAPDSLPDLCGGERDDEFRGREERRQHGSEFSAGGIQIGMEVQIQLEEGSGITLAVRSLERPEIVTVELNRSGRPAGALLIEERREIARRLEGEGITLRELIVNDTAEQSDGRRT